MEIQTVSCNPERIVKINEKLLYLLNKYRSAYFRSLELIDFYESILKNGWDQKKEQEIFTSYTKKRQLEDIFPEDIFLRKRMKREKLESCSVDITPYVNKTNIDKKNQPNKMNQDIEKIKSEYVNLDTLDFNSYVEDMEGCVQYCAKAGKDNTSNHINKQVNAVDAKKKPAPGLQPKSNRPVLKSTYSRIMQSTYKSSSVEKNPKTTFGKNTSFLDRSVYQRVGSKPSGIEKKGVKPIGAGLDRMDMNKSVYVPNQVQRQATHMNKSVYIGSKNITNKGPPLSDKHSVYKSTFKSKMQPPGTKKGDVLSKHNPPLTTQGTTNLNNPNQRNPPSMIGPSSARSVYINKNMMQKSMYKSSKDSMMNLTQHSKGKAKVPPLDIKDMNELNDMKNLQGQIKSSQGYAKSTTREPEERSNVKMEKQNTQMQIKEESNREIEMGEDTKSSNAFFPLTMDQVESLVEEEEKGKQSTEESELDQLIINPIELPNGEISKKEPVTCKEENNQDDKNALPLENKEETKLKFTEPKRGLQGFGRLHFTEPTNRNLNKIIKKEKENIKEENIKDEETKVKEEINIEEEIKEEKEKDSNIIPDHIENPEEKNTQKDIIQINTHSIKEEDHLITTQQETPTQEESFVDTETIKFKNAILNINEEIKNKLNESLQSNASSVKSRTVSNSTDLVKTNSVPFKIKKQEEPNKELDEYKKINNNRANLYVEMNINVEYMDLNIVDLDQIIQKGVCHYKNAEDTFIECSSNTKDLIIYNEIMKTEKRTICFVQNTEIINKNNLLNEEKEGNIIEEIEVKFKSSNEIKLEIVQIIGISIFQNVNHTIFPAKSLMQDDKLPLWFTKKKKDKDYHKTTRLDPYTTPTFKFTVKRMSNMGMFSQPLIIMLSSLKRQSVHTNLRKIIHSLILCTSDSSALEKILHTVPEENSKNYSQWEESMNKLSIFVGERKNECIDQMLEISTQEENKVMEGDTNLTKINSLDSIEEMDHFNPNSHAYMNRMHNNFDSSFNNSFESNINTPQCRDKNKMNKKKENNAEHIYEDEEFCLFIGTIHHAHKRFRYLLLVDNFEFIYEDLIKHIKNKLSNIQLIINKHILLKQLFCNILFLCNWLNEPKKFKWFLWNDVFRKIESLYGYSENGKISRERSIMLLLAEHTGEVFTDKELNHLKKISKFHIKDLYDKTIDFINSYLELKNQMTTEEFKINCCICIDGKNIHSKDKFLEKIEFFVQKNYQKMLYIIYNLDLLIKQYLILIIWLGDIKPFYPFFSYVDEKKKVIYSHDLFVNFVFFFESYNKYVNIIKKKNEEKEGKEEHMKKMEHTNDVGRCSEMGFVSTTNNKQGTEFYALSKHSYPEIKKRKSLTNTVNYACEIKRKSLELNKNYSRKRKGTNSDSSVEFESDKS